MALRIAIASGKGGTGKTTLAVNLAHVAAQAGETVCYADCDVEEPNGHLFLNPTLSSQTPSTIPVPVVDASLCTACGLCAKICRFGAIARLGKFAMVFPELCHGCGGCALVCPEHAITEEPRAMGMVERGHARGISFVQGRLTIGEAMSPPLIADVKRALPVDGFAILDAPPGTSCPMITAIRGADYVVLVTEPTPFGLNDLALALEAVRTLGLPCGVVINRHDPAVDSGHVFCREHDVTLLGVIPDDRRIAEAYSTGRLACEVLPEYQSLFLTLWRRILHEASPDTSPSEEMA